MNLALSLEAGYHVAQRYTAFMAQTMIQSFRKEGGNVFAASEHRSASDIRALIDAGHRHFAEKFVQEVEAKWSRLPARLVTLHGYGNLQTNKAARACRLFECIESLGRDSLRVRLETLLKRGTRVPPLYLQVNVGAEPQKGGYTREEAAFALESARKSGLEIRGVMAIPPRQEDPTPHYRWLRRFADRERLPECMMGMSEDFHVAIGEGATAIRIGRLIFGPKAFKAPA